MINRILEIIDSRTNHQTMPEDIRSFILQSSPDTLKSAENLIY